MKLQSLGITRGSIYSPNPGVLTGKCELVGATGKLEVTLSANALSKIIDIAQVDVQGAVKETWQGAAIAMRDAIEEPLNSTQEEGLAQLTNEATS